jgi:YggT family protein
MWQRRGTRLSAHVAAVPIPAMFPALTRRRAPLAVVIPGDSVLETTTIGGLSVFFNVFQNVIVARILLSWFPGLAQQPVLRPLFTICDPFLNTFRQVVPPVFGLDLSPILAIFLLQTLGGASQALGAEVPADGAPRSARGKPALRMPRAIGWPFRH